MVTVQIPTDKIGALIGPGGSNIKGMQEQYGVSIDVDDTGTVVIGSTSSETVEEVSKAIRLMTKEIKAGEIYTGKVVKVMDFGCFVNLIPGKDGMVHISELSDSRVPTVESVAREGQELTVMVVNVDQNGRVDLSVRAIIDQNNYNGDHDRALQEALERRGPGNRGGRGGRSGGNDRGGNRGRSFDNRRSRDDRGGRDDRRQYNDFDHDRPSGRRMVQGRPRGRRPSR